MAIRREADGSFHVSAPKRLGVFQDRIPATLRFMRDIRAAAFDVTAPKLVISFEGCTAISRAACLLITAELRRALHNFHAGKIDVMTPTDTHLANLFEAFGIYHYFNVPSPLTAQQRRRSRLSAIVVRSGGVSREEVLGKLAEIAAVASKVCRKKTTAAAVDEALQEALFNAGEHAYVGMDHAALPDDRWWFAGLFDPDKQEAFFYALDHGVGIPTRAEALMGPEFAAYWASSQRFKDAAGGCALDPDRLEAAIRAPRLDLEGREGRGQGLPTIVGLVDSPLHGEVR